MDVASGAGEDADVDTDSTSPTAAVIEQMATEANHDEDAPSNDAPSEDSQEGDSDDAEEEVDDEVEYVIEAIMGAKLNEVDVSSRLLLMGF
jgi:hypothetical protein